MTHRVLATPKLIEETRMLREASELQFRILKGKCDQAMAERDELVAFKVSTQKRIEELEERRGLYELKFSPELDVDAISQRLEALPPLDGMQVGPSSPKTSRFSDKRNLQTALREVCVHHLQHRKPKLNACISCAFADYMSRWHRPRPCFSSKSMPFETSAFRAPRTLQHFKIASVSLKRVWIICAQQTGTRYDLS